MNTRGLSRYRLLTLLLCATLSLLLAACQPAGTPTQAPAPTQAPKTTQTLIPTTAPASVTSNGITLALAGLAQSQNVETVAAVPAGKDSPYWLPAPQYRRVTLSGYPVNNHQVKAQISVYPLAELKSANENATGEAAALQTLLRSHKAEVCLPFLPLTNAQQVLHAQVQYLDFKSGQGVRYLTQYAQGPVTVNNFELFYTFQGLTGDGKYYVSAVLPLTHAQLPATSQVNATAVAAQDYPAYVQKTSAWLDQQPASAFTPDLSVLDALIRSLTIE